MNLQDMFGLDGRIALVTGGSRGIGKMIVEGYLAAGCARVYISARKTAQIEEALGDHLADAARAAGDEGHAAFQREQSLSHDLLPLR